MERSQLEHILRAAAGITGASEFVVIGSQSVHGEVQSPPAECLISMEADLFTFRSPADADLIDGSIGEASPFHRTFGYYAHGVGEETAVLPDGWKQRLVRFKSQSTGGATGLCLDVHDLGVSKLVAGREKDSAYLAALLRHGALNPVVLAERLSQTRLDSQVRTACERRMRDLSAGV